MQLQYFVIFVRMILEALQRKEGHNMKKMLLIFGIVSIVACIVFLLLFALYMHGYYNIFDGSPELYDRLHRKMIIYLVIGIVFLVIGTVSLIIRSKI